MVVQLVHLTITLCMMTIERSWKLLVELLDNV